MSAAVASFDREAAAPERLVQVGPDQAEAMRALFAEVFGHEMSAAHWHWKYADGHGVGVGLLREGRMVAHYGGVPRRVLFRGRPELACQVCDVMVARSANAALVRKGPLYRVAARFLDAEVGFGRPHLLAFGFPSARHHAVAERLGLYGQLDRFVSLSWPAAAQPGGPRPSVQPIGRAGRGFDAAETRVVDRLWRAMAAALPEAIVGVRDAAWLRHRYLMHPGWRYELLLVRHGWLRRPLGVVVLRAREADRLELLDVVGAPAAYPALVRAARSRAHALGLPRVEAWITESQRTLLAPAGEATVTDLQIPLPHIVHTPGPAAEEQRGRWLLLGGDADFT
jgi:hypothetical protein